MRVRCACVRVRACARVRARFRSVICGFGLNSIYPFIINQDVLQQLIIDGSTYTEHHYCIFFSLFHCSDPLKIFPWNLVRNWLLVRYSFSFLNNFF